MTEPVREWRAVVQVITIAKFKRPQEPKRCSLHRYHVWRWQAAPFDPRFQPITGMKCQCGLLEWTHRANMEGAER